MYDKTISKKKTIFLSVLLTLVMLVGLVPTQNGYAELRKVMRIYNSAPELSADARIALTVKETGFAEKKRPNLLPSARLANIPSACPESKRQ